MAEPIEDSRTLPAKSLAFWFDYTCPFAYLGSTQAKAVAARMGVPLTYEPLLLGGVFRSLGTPQNLQSTRSPQRGAHELADMQRWARRFGVPLTMPAEHPRRSVEALRATLACGVDPKVIDGFFRAYWAEGRDIAAKEVIASVVAAAGHDAADVLARLESPAIKQALRERTDEGLARGIFGVPAWIVDGTHLYWGQDRMAFVEGVRPGPPVRVASRAKTVEVFWDFSSPFAYLGVSQLGALAARTGATIVSHPMLLGGLFRSLGGPDVPLATFPEAKQRYVGQDLKRWAAYWRVPFRFPSRFPTSSVKALRTYLALPEGLRAGFRDRVFSAYWAEDRDITSDEVLADCVADPAAARAALARAVSDEVKAALRASTDDALARGVFGAPTFVVDGELFWGQDRLDLVEAAL